MSVDAGVIEGATAVLGAPLAPPFDTPGRAATPSPNDGSPTSGAMDALPWLVLVALAALAALLVVLTRRQRRYRGSSG